ncbi:methylosome subunit pICln isoform X2 [Anabrus simplex]
MVDTKIDGESEICGDDVGQDGSGDESDPGMTELRFVPDDKGMLDAMFHAMSECQALHPDPQDSFSDDDEIYEDADDEEGEYQLGGGDAAIIINSSGFAPASNGVNAEEEPMELEVGQFEDAEGEPDN